MGQLARTLLWSIQSHCVEGRLINGDLRESREIWKTFYVVLPYGGVSESLTDTKLEGT